MIMVVLRCFTLGGVLIAGTAAMSPDGRAPAAPVALRQLEKGQWELRDRAARTDAPRQRICVGDPSQLLRAGHGAGDCDQFVVADRPDRAVVTYQCKGRGNGRTDLRVETPRLVQIQSQGVSGGAPFAVELEARRTGDCN